MKNTIPKLQIVFISAFLILLLFPADTYAQENKTKFKSKKKAQDPDSRALIRSAGDVSEKNPKRALDYLSEALELCLRSGDKSCEADVYKSLGLINYQQGLEGKSEEFYLKAISIYSVLEDKTGEMQSRNGLGLTLKSKKELDKALQQFQTALQLSESAGNVNSIIEIKNNIAATFEAQGKNEQALKTYQEVLAIEEKRNNKNGIYITSNNIGNVYLKQDKTTDAKKYYQKSSRIASNSSDQKQVNESFDNISKTLRKENRLDDELEIRKKLAEVNTKLNDEKSLTENYLEIGKIYVEQKELESAVPYLENSIKLSEKTGKLAEKGEAHIALSDAYKQQGEFFKALENYKAYVAVKDSILAQKERALVSASGLNEQLSLKQNKIDLLEKDMQLNGQTIEILQQEKSIFRLIIYSLSGGLAIVFISSWLIFNSSRKRRIANQILALRSLRSQMNPHFIFNALNSVNNYISKNDERAANKYLSDFSRLMRTVMENSQHEFISLTSEIEILRLYLTLEHSRFKEKFDFELNVTENILTEQIQIPPMLIQPYIENAVWHGLRYRQDKGLLKVNILEDTAGLSVVIEDNGIGRKKSAELKTANQKDKISTGLKNTESRLKIINELYSAKMNVTITDLDSDARTGTKVTVFIGSPKKRID